MNLYGTDISCFTMYTTPCAYCKHPFFSLVFREEGTITMFWNICCGCLLKENVCQEVVLSKVEETCVSKRHLLNILLLREIKRAFVQEICLFNTRFLFNDLLRNIKDDSSIKTHKSSAHITLVVNTLNAGLKTFFQSVIVLYLYLHSSLMFFYSNFKGIIDEMQTKVKIKDLYLFQLDCDLQ